MRAKNNNFNDYEVTEEYTKIFIRRRNGEELVTLIDNERLEELIDLGYRWFPKWHKDAKKYYVHCTIYLGMVNGQPKYKNIMLHRYLLNTKAKAIDHINNDPLDNRIANLRASTTKENTKNRGSKNSNNTSGYRNVSWSKSENKWIVQLQIKGKNTKLDSFDDVHEAGEYAEKMRKKHYGSYAGKN